MIWQTFQLEFQEVRSEGEKRIVIVLVVQPEEDADEPSAEIQALAAGVLQAVRKEVPDLALFQVRVEYLP